MGIPKEVIKKVKEYKNAEEFADKIRLISLEERPIINNFPINKIKKTNFYKSELLDANKEIESGEYKRTSNEPIRLFYNIKNNEYSMVDGFHRLAKVLKKGILTINAGIEITGTKQDLEEFYNEITKNITEQVNKIKEKYNYHPEEVLRKSKQSAQ